MSLVSVAALLGALTALMMQPAHAAVPGNCLNPGNYLAGASSAFNTSVRGARATIEFNNPDLCEADATSHSASTAWAMVTAGSAILPGFDATEGWAQTGYGDFGSNSGFTHSGLHVFAQYTLKCKSAGSCVGASNSTTFGGTVSTTHEYENAWRSSDSFIHMAIDGTHLVSTTYDPAGDWDGDWSGQFAGETLNAESDVPGTSSDVTSFTHVEKYDASGNTTFFSSISPNSLFAVRYHRYTTSPSSGGVGLDIYTNPLTSY